MKTIYKTKKILFTAVLLSLSSQAFSEINVDQSNGVLSITSDIEGTVSAKIIDPNDKVEFDTLEECCRTEFGRETCDNYDVCAPTKFTSMPPTAFPSTSPTANPIRRPTTSPTRDVSRYLPRRVIYKANVLDC